MNVFETFLQAYEFNRARTLGLLKQAEEAGDASLMWRPGDGRAHIAWQLAHIAITEDIFAADRLGGGNSSHSNQWESFRGGSTPSDEQVSAETIRTWLKDGRASLLDTLSRFDESQLDEVVWVRPRTNQPLSLLMVLNIIGWHEAHHQGQGHITLNLFNATH